MSLREFKSQVDCVQSLAPAARTASANGTGANLQGYNSAMAVFECGALTDGTHTPKLQESDDNSSYSDVAAADYVGGSAPTALSANTVARYGYIGTKQYVRAVMTVAGATTGAVTSAVILRGHPAQAPLS